MTLISLSFSASFRKKASLWLHFWMIASREGKVEHREILRQALATEVEPSFETLAAELR